MDELVSIARRYSLHIVEDAAHAFGSRYQGRLTGSLGDLGCFSFNPVKNITCGEGGAVVTHREDLAQRIRLRRNLGIDTDTWSRLKSPHFWDYSVETTGFRYAMPNLNAAIGLVQFRRREEFQTRKQAIVRRYDQVFQGLEDLSLIRKSTGDEFIYSYVVRILGGRRDALLAHLSRRAPKISRGWARFSPSVRLRRAGQEAANRGGDLFEIRVGERGIERQSDQLARELLGHGETNAGLAEAGLQMVGAVVNGGADPRGRSPKRWPTWPATFPACASRDLSRTSIRITLASCVECPCSGSRRSHPWPAPMPRCAHLPPRSGLPTFGKYWRWDSSSPP